jgi:sodium/hydrogen antiporter
VPYESVVYIASVVLAYALFSRLLARSPITGPMFFMAAGVFGTVLGVWDPVLEVADARIVLELTLALVLFTEAMKLRLVSWQEDFELSTRLLGIGLPLTIAAGTIAAFLLFDVSLAAAAGIATVLAPTDAALGLAVVENPRVPARIREALSVESGLNDGIALPVLLFFIGVVGAEEGDPFWSLVAESIGVAVVVGVVFAVVVGITVREASRRGWMQERWQQIIVVIVPIATFAVADQLDGSGFIATFVAGLVFGRLIEGLDESIADFGDDVGTALTMFSFLLFGGLFLAESFDVFSLRTVVFAILALTVVRGVPVAISMARSGLAAQTVLFMGWFGPRGLASIIFAAVVVEEFGVADSAPLIEAMIVTVTFSIVLHGASAYHGSQAYADWYERATRP